MYITTKIKTVAAGIFAVYFLVSAGLTARAEAVQSAPTESVAGLSARFWQLAISIPTAGNPLADTTGAICMSGNRGAVWFLYGTLSGGSAARTCTIPEGKWLFVPIYNNIELNTPGVCGQGIANLTVQELRSFATAAVDSVTSLHVVLDGVSLDDKVIRTPSPVYEVTFPVDNIFGCPAGVYSPGVADGYYLLLRPLRVGTHHLHFTSAAPHFSLNVTYDLVIVPVSFR